jgi:hypothetical protein
MKIADSVAFVTGAICGIGLAFAHELFAEKPFADLDPVWGKGIINGDQCVQIVYLTL